MSTQSLGDALRAGARRLRAGGIDTPERDARALLLWAAGIGAADLIIEERSPIPAAAAERLDRALAERLARKPVSKITGHRLFCGLDFTVTPDVLDPRPETETLVDAALAAAKGHESPRILDLGTGSGCILLSLLANLPNARGVGVDLSEAALKVAQGNAQKLNLAEKVAFLRSNWLEKVDGVFELVVCNPPYIARRETNDLSEEVVNWDPELALFADKEGFDAYHRISRGLARVLSANGTAFFEIGAGQDVAAAELFRRMGFDDVSLHADLDGRVRCLEVRRNVLTGEAPHR